MAFSKSFPNTIKGSNYPHWEEVFLTVEEETEQEVLTRKENIQLMEACIEDAKKIVASKGLKDYQTDIIHMAVALFEKRASHSIHKKESKAKEKFDTQNKA